MADKISGKIEYLNENKNGFYNIKVGGEYYSIGKYAPRGIGQGDNVEFEIEYNGNFKNVAKGTLRKLEASVAPPTSTSKSFKAASSFDDRQDVISKQAALNTALAFLEFAKANETLPVPKQKNAGYGYLKTIWLKEAAELYELNTGKVWDLPEENVEEEAPRPVKKAAKKAPPAQQEEDYDEDQLPDDDQW